MRTLDRVMRRSRIISIWICSKLLWLVFLAVLEHRNSGKVEVRMSSELKLRWRLVFLRVLKH